MTHSAPDTLQTAVEALAAELRADVSYPEPHRRVLGAAMALMGERGYAGGSLRELARRLEMSQPSLYHYFDSKAQLVEQVVRHQTARALRAPDDLPTSPSLQEGLRYSLQRLIENYRDPEHVAFMRFLVTVGAERPEVQLLARELLVERGKALLTRFVDLYVDAGEVRAEDSRNLVELVLDGFIMRMLRQHVLFPAAGGESTPEDTERFADFVVDTAVRGVRARLADQQPAHARSNG